MNISTLKKYGPLILLVAVLAATCIIVWVCKEDPPVDDTLGSTSQITDPILDLPDSSGESMQTTTDSIAESETTTVNTTETEPSVDTTEVPTESTTGDATEVPTEPTTGDATDDPTETTIGGTTEAPNDDVTAPSTQAPTNSTQPTTDSPTEPTSNDITEPTRPSGIIGGKPTGNTSDKFMDDPTEATTSSPTEEPTQPPTEATTQPPTVPPTEPTTEEPTQPSTEEPMPEGKSFYLDIKAPTTAAVGDVVDVVITLKNIKEPLCAVEFFLDFDETKLAGVITEGGAAMDAFMTVTPMYTMAIAGMEIPVSRFEQICYYDASNGVYECRFLDLLQYPNEKVTQPYHGLINDGDLVITLQFKVLETAKKGDRLSFTTLSDSIIGTTRATLNGVPGASNSATMEIK